MTTSTDPRGPLAALCALTHLALAEVERRGELTDDQPELSLAVIERWLHGEETDAALDDAVREVDEAVEAHVHAHDSPAALIAALHALGVVARASRALAAGTAEGLQITAPTGEAVFWVEACL